MQQQTQRRNESGIVVGPPVSAAMNQERCYDSFQKSHVDAVTWPAVANRLVNARLAKILQAENYDFTKHEPIPWCPTDASSRADT